MKTLSILLTDDQSMVREGLSLILKQHFPEAKFLQADSGPQALQRLTNNRIDLLLLDISMPGMNGIEVAKEVLKNFPKTKIIVLTQYNGEAMITHLIQLGVHGFLLKNSSSDEIKKAINTVLEDAPYFTPAIHSSLLKRVSSPNVPSINFNKREAEILVYLKMGKSSREIAKKMELKENTINSYREEMLLKTKTKNVAELISYAYQNGVLG